MNKYIAKVTASIILFVISLTLIIVGIVKVAPGNSGGTGNTQNTSIVSGNLYNITANKNYQISTDSYTTMTITVYGTKSLFSNAPEVLKNGATITYSDYNIYSTYVIYTYRVSKGSKYVISFSSVSSSTTSQFRVNLKY